VGCQLPVRWLPGQRSKPSTTTADLTQHDARPTVQHSNPQHAMKPQRTSSKKMHATWR
jgi:hypothetical protein